MSPAAFFLFAAFAAQQTTPPDAHALLAQGTALISTKPTEAIKILQQAVRLDPSIPELRLQLGLAFQAIGDEADAESELRIAAERMPDSAPVHNYLGIALFQLGDLKAALEEFRRAVKLAPNDANAHFNLGEALARTGQTGAAVDELRVATGLAPSDAGLARLMQNVRTALTTPESTIKVDVRQVLVPVVVTDKDGRHVNGLNQNDFKVFEDGVEQQITAFTVESSSSTPAGVPNTAAPASAAATSGASAPLPPVHRTYFVIIDTLHQSYNHFAAARDSLAKLFAEEHRGEDSQYVAVALGASAEIIHNVTRDPAEILAVLRSKKMEKIFLDGQQGGVRQEMERYRRDLTETRYACDLYEKTGDMPFQVKCQSGKTRAPNFATEVAELDRTVTRQYLAQFKSLVAQLARGRDRRTMILMSEGFEIVPGREAYDLMLAFFPDMRQYGMRAGERMQDAWEPILQMAARANITIDTIDSRGLYGLAGFDATVEGTPSSAGGSVDRVERNVAAAQGNTLAEIAEATGGTAFHDSNNLLSGLERAFADGRDYYTLAYVSTNTVNNGRFRAIKVQVVNHPGATINAKKGYWSELAAQ